MTRTLLAVAAGLTLAAAAWCATLTIWSAVLRYTLDDRALAVLATALLLPTLGLGALTLTLYRKAHAMPAKPGDPAYGADALARKLDADLMAASAVDNASRPNDPTDDAGHEHHEGLDA